MSREDIVASVCDRYDARADALLEILHDVQDTVGFIPRETIPGIAERLQLSRAEVYGVVSFYHDFSLHPPGRHTVSVCCAEACQARGGWDLQAHAQASLGVHFGETTADGCVTLKEAYCFGNCALGPAVRIDERLVANVSPDRFDELIGELDQ